ncbi:MAG: hypothetical protein EBR01_13690 [Proteobacteria bacterium]|nr:hypothetical protein [Pseudomonadota bacterium]
MTRIKSALIIGTEVSTNGFESGGSLRIDSIKNLLENNNFEVSLASRATAKKFLNVEWDMVILISFSTARYLRRARKRTRALWFDPTDSWTLTRFSLFRNGDVRQILLFFRDAFWVWTCPKLDLITFITERDAESERLWWKFRQVPLILGIYGLDRQIIPGGLPRLVFVGDGAYMPNNIAVEFLVNTLAHLPSEMIIELYGRDLFTSNRRFICHGYASATELYRENDIHLAPITTGGGLKLKVAIPLWNGLRVVSTPEGANGFRSSPLLRIANNPEAFAKSLLEIMNSSLEESLDPPRSSIYMHSNPEQIEEWLLLQNKAFE